MNIDPLAEISRKFSPYAYALGNPVVFVDPDGTRAMGSISDYNWQTGEYRSGSLDAAMNNVGAEWYDIDKADYSSILAGIEKAYDALMATADGGGGGDKNRPGAPPTLDGANKYYVSGKGGIYYIDASKIDLNFLAQDIQNWKVDEYREGIQTLWSSKDGRIFGQLNLTYLGDNKFKIHDDYYDFDDKPWNSLKNIGRNILI